jgi:hypothetical protein
MNPQPIDVALANLETALHDTRARLGLHRAPPAAPVAVEDRIAEAAQAAAEQLIALAGQHGRVARRV